MKNVVLFYVVVVLLNLNGICCFAQAKSLGNDYGTFNDAVNAYSMGNYKRSLVIVENILKKDSVNTNALLLKSRLYQSYYKDYNSAMMFIDKALRFEPNNRVLWKDKVQLFLNQNKCIEAMHILQSVPVEILDEDFLILNSNIAICANKLDATQAAQKILRSYLENNQSLRVMMQLGTIYLLTDRDSAIMYFKKCMSLDSTNADHYINIATAYLTDHKNQDAKNILERGVGKCIDKDKLYFLLSKIYFDIDKNIPGSLDYLNKAIERRPTQEYYVQRAEVYDSIGRPDLGYADYKFLLKELPWKLPYLRAVVNYELLSASFNKVVETINNSAAYDESLKDSCATFLLKSYFYLGKFDSAFHYIDRNEVLKSKEFNDIYIRAVLLSIKGRSKESMELCQTLIKAGKLNEEQEFNVTVLRSLLFLLDKKYESFYDLADMLYRKYKDSFIKGYVFNRIKSEKEAKREITLKAKGDLEFVIAISITEDEFKVIQNRYNLPNQ